MDQLTLAALPRETTGKGAARRLRQKDRVPVVFYGPDTETRMLSVESRDLKRIYRHSTGENVILALEIKTESGAETRQVMIKELQADPCSDRYVHLDFYEISMDKELTLQIPVHLVNTPVGVTHGGVLQHVRREITISCLPGSLVDAVELDVSGLDIGDVLHVSDLELPGGITVAEEGHLTVALVAAPATAERAEEEEEEQAPAEAAEEEAPGEPTE